MKTDDYRGHTLSAAIGVQKAGLVCDSFALGIKEGFRADFGLSPEFGL